MTEKEAIIFLKRLKDADMRSLTLLDRIGIADEGMKNQTRQKMEACDAAIHALELVAEFKRISAEGGTP